MAMGRPKMELVLSDSEREQLLVWSRRRRTSQSLAMRARIILNCADGLQNKAVAAQYSISPQMVGK